MVVHFQNIAQLEIEKRVNLLHLKSNDTLTMITENIVTIFHMTIKSITISEEKLVTAVSFFLIQFDPQRIPSIPLLFKQRRTH